MMKPTDEQLKILSSDKKNMIVSASAGSGKTFVVIEYLLMLITQRHVPLNQILVLTFTKAAANEMRTRALKAIQASPKSEFMTRQLDEIYTSDISTIDSFCEKLIRRNIDKLNISEGFSVIDENVASSLKAKAFAKTIEKVADEEYFDQIYFTFKRNKDEIFALLSSMQTYLDSQDDSEELLDNVEQNILENSKKAEDYIIERIKGLQAKANKTLENIFEVEENYSDFYMQLLNISKIEIDGDFCKICKVWNDIAMPSLPRFKTDKESDKEKMKKARDYLSQIKGITQNYFDLDKEKYDQLINNQIAKNVIKMYRVYHAFYQKLKEERDGIDFADIEKITRQLLQDEGILKQLQDKYKYIFIDEYQDTNPLQEAIIKPIAEKGAFIAVGDQKQGIYGFRNASMEIMQKDIENFTIDDDSVALNLTGNFRSDGRVLEFINSIFEKVMTKESMGIDYKNTSMLKGMKNFGKGSLPSVNVDLVAKDTQKRENLESIYDIEKDLGINLSKNKREVDTILARIDELLKSEIYDGKLERKRKVNQSDIVILFRSRGSIMNECYHSLLEKGYSAVASAKLYLLDDYHIRVVQSLLSLALNFKNDIALASVLNSQFGKITLEQLLQIKGQEKFLYEAVQKSSNEKVIKFLADFEKLKFDMQIFGINKALRLYFEKTSYYAFINSLSDAQSRRTNLEKFLNIILSSGNDFNLPRFLSYLDDNKIPCTMAENSVDAITLTTIHATKGLEFPIVILAGAGESLAGQNMHGFNFNSTFGLGTSMVDLESNIKYPSPIYIANNLYKKRKEFIDEIMIFYVALTRAQNHLYIIGQAQEKDIEFTSDIFDRKNYLEIILNALGENFTSQIFSQGQVETENYRFSIIDEDLQYFHEQKNIANDKKIGSFDDKVIQYLNFYYPNSEICKLPFKNSVTALLNLNKDYSASEKEYILNNIDDFGIGQVTNVIKVSREDRIKQGLAYHEALKLLDFDKISCALDCQRQLSEIAFVMHEGYAQLIDADLLYKNIARVKDVLKGQKAQKEKQFIMNCTLKEIGVKDIDEKVIVQGIIDLFSLGENKILIDFKYTSTFDEEKIVERYIQQIKLYRMALVKAYDIKIDKCYILSLKNANLIKVDL